MSPKNAIKLRYIYIRIFYSVHAVIFGPLWFYSAYFGPIRSIWSILVILSPFCPLWSDSVLFGPFGLLWSNSVHSVHFGSIRFTLVLFGPFCPLRSYLLDIGLIQSILVLFGPIWFYLIHYVHIGPNLSIHSYSVLSSPHWSYSVHISTLCPIWTTLVLFYLSTWSFFLRKHSVHFCALTYREKICLGWKRLFQI